VGTRPNTTNVFSGNTKNVQIQQHSTNSTQSMNIQDGFDFEKALEIFNHVIANIESFSLEDVEKNNLLKVATEAKALSESSTESGIVHKSVATIKDIMLRATGSLTASGILHLISQMGV